MWLHASAEPQKKTSCLVIVTVIVAMKVLGVSVTLCTILTLSRALAFNSTLQTGRCENERQNCSSSFGAHCPQCDNNGNYLPQQCSGSTGYCWCVNITSGNEIPDTLKAPGHNPDCGLCKEQQQNCSSMLGAFCPQCDSNGNFLHKQCSGSTGYCWCVDIITGKTLSNTTTPPGTQPDCDQAVGSNEDIETLPEGPGPVCVNCGLCKEEHRHCRNMPGAFCPQCDSNGNFLPLQCSGSTGYCWCVDIITGNTLSNTTMPPGTQPDCGLCKEEQQHCRNMPGAFCPKCDSNGNFLPLQCSGSTGYCWCVNIFSGKEIPNTSTAPGRQPVCGQAEGSEEDIETQPEGPGSEEETSPTCVDCDKDSHECPKGWVKFGNQCFIFIHTPKTWINAEVYCQFERANLASVHCEKGNRFIMSLTRGDTHNFPQTWLGGFDAIHPGYWMWSDGSQFDYENWYENDQDDDEHDNHDKHDKKRKNCLRMNYEYDLKWFHSSCTDSLPFVCAKSILTPSDHPM